MTLLTDLEQFASTTAPTVRRPPMLPNPPGVLFGRWITPEEVELDLLRAVAELSFKNHQPCSG